MDNRELLNFRFVDRIEAQKTMRDYLHSGTNNPPLWILGDKGVGITRLINEVISKDDTNEVVHVFCSFDDDKDSYQLSELIAALQEKAKLKISDFIKANYTQILDISKKVSSQILKLAGIDVSDFVASFYDSSKLFVNQKQQQHSSLKVLNSYISHIIKRNTLVVILEHFPCCNKNSADFFMQVIMNFIDTSNIFFIITSTKDEFESNQSFVGELLSKIPINRLEIKPLDDIYFYEILQDKFFIPNEARNIVSQFSELCEGSPMRLHAALTKMFMNGTIKLNSNTNTAEIDLDELKKTIKFKDLSFDYTKLDFCQKSILRLIIAFKEHASLELLIKSSSQIIRKIAKIPMTEEKISDAAFILLSNEVICINSENNVKIANSLIRDAIEEAISQEPIHRLFSNYILEYILENKEQIVASGISKELLEYLIVLHSIIGVSQDWIEQAVNYGLSLYDKNHIAVAIEIFNHVKKEVKSVASDKLTIIADCYFQDGNYETAEQLLQLVADRNDYETWQFYYSFCKVENLLLKKDFALELAQNAENKSANIVEQIKSLNMQQQILVDMSDGKEAAAEIFNRLIEMGENYDEQVEKAILPTLKCAIDFYHGQDAFVYLNQAEEKAIKFNYQFEEALILTNKGFEYFRQGNLIDAKSCFDRSIEMLTNLRIHEISYPLNNLANYYMSKDMFHNAITIITKANMWNTSTYVSISLKTLLMVCYAHTAERERSLKIASELIDYIRYYKITDNTMLRKIYLNIALVYKHLNEPESAINEYAEKAYKLSANTSSWYRAYDVARKILTTNDDPLSHCLPDEEWYWTNGKYEPWLVTFSHD